MRIRRASALGCFYEDSASNVVRGFSCDGWSLSRGRSLRARALRYQMAGIDSRAPDSGARGALQATTNPTGWLYIAQGRTDRLFSGAYGSQILVILALYLGARAGSIFTVAVAYLIINMILAIPCLWLAVSPGRYRDLSSVSRCCGARWPISRDGCVRASRGRAASRRSRGAGAALLDSGIDRCRQLCDVTRNIALRSAAFLDLKQQLSRSDRFPGGPYWSRGGRSRDVFV